MYLEKIADKQFLKKAIIKYELVDKENYNTEESFNEAVLRLASSIKIIEKINQNTYKIEGVGSPIIKHLQMSIVANINNKKKWESALFFIHEHTNKFIKDHIRLSFQNDISKLKQQYKYRLEDIEIELLNVKETYKRTTKDRLAFLNEQREIARHLGVATSTIAAQTFLADKGVVASFELDMPYYLKGYEMIEKEIELVKNRSDEEAFMPDLLDLENIKRKIFQSEKKLKRIERVFAKTPVVDLDNFYAADLAIRTTSFIKQNTNNSLSKKLILAVLIGGILGVVFSLIWVNRKKFK
jgi:LPS O-antigen subunit length determinant protein (WzzB/FepE family)